MRPALNCEIETRAAGSQRLEITYRTRGVAWQAHYVAVVSNDAKTARLSGSVSLTNASGLSFHDARVRLVGRRHQTMTRHMA